MDQTVLRVLAQEVQRRKCPNCGNPLRSASISTAFLAADRVGLHFRCAHCVFEGGGEIELTAEIYKEAAENPVPEQHERPTLDPITADEVLSVHELLSSWRLGLQELIASPQPEPPVLPG
jgi:hypothetical protein